MPARKSRSYGIGQAAREARLIATQIAHELNGTRLDGPHARDAIRIAAARCPLVRSPQQVQAIIDGWEGIFSRIRVGSVRQRICFAAGRQLATLNGVFS